MTLAEMFGHLNAFCCGHAMCAHARCCLCCGFENLKINLNFDPFV